MSYDKTNWQDRLVERPRTFTVSNNADGSITLTPSPGTVVQEGTPVNASNMNKIEGAIEELFTSVSSGKTLLETAVADMGGQVSKAGAVATFGELDAGVRSIPTGDYAIGDTVAPGSIKPIFGSIRLVNVGTTTTNPLDVIAVSADGRGVAYQNGTFYTAYKRDGVLVSAQDASQGTIYEVLFDRLNDTYVYGLGYYCTKLQANPTTPKVWEVSGVGGSVGAALASGGVVYLYYNQIGKVTADGVRTTLVTGLSENYRCVAVDGADNIYYCNSAGTVKAYSIAGTLLWSQSFSPLLPSSMVCHGDRLYVSYYNTGNYKYGLACYQISGAGATLLWNDEVTGNLSMNKHGIHFDADKEELIVLGTTFIRRYTASLTNHGQLISSKSSEAGMTFNKGMSVSSGSGRIVCTAGATYNSLSEYQCDIEGYKLIN